MITETGLNFFSVFNFLGISIGLLLSYVFIKKGDKNNVANIYQGLLLLTLSLAMFEEVLNDTGYIVQILPISNFAEPFNFVFGPLFYLYIKRSLTPEFKKKDLFHFVVFLLWFIYMILYFIQSNELKYNSYIGSKHPDWSYIEMIVKFDDDPLRIRPFVNLATQIHFVIYLFLSVRFFLSECKKRGISFLKTRDPRIENVRNINIHFLFLILIIIFTKIKFPSDVGDHFIFAYISFMIISTAYRILIVSSYFEQPASFMNFPLSKYRKSSLDVETKQQIIKKIENEFIKNKYYLNNLASLGELSKIIRESSHHVSQVINEQLNMNFFELLAKYRVEEAKKIILTDKDKKLTIEEIAERVGYNSKSAFNNAFKKITQQNPSDFRENSQIE